MSRQVTGSAERITDAAERAQFITLHEKADAILSAAFKDASAIRRRAWEIYHRYVPPKVAKEKAP